MRTTASHIAGRTATDSPGGQLDNFSPHHLTTQIAEVFLGDASTFVEGARAAKAAQSGWAQVPAPIRGATIGNLGRLVADNKEALSQIVTSEIGKPIAEARGEVQEIIDTCNFFLSEGRRLYGQTVPSEMPSKDLFTFRRPVGTAAIITAGNFPVAVPSWYLIPALVAGNSIVWKPAEYAARSAEAFYELIVAAGVPADVVNLVICDGPAAFEGLSRSLDEKLINKIGFTGSSVVGVEIGQLAARHFQSACLELGGKNPMVIMPDANLDLAVQGALFSGFGTAGQRCTSLGTVIVHQSIAAEFTERFDQATRKAVIGDPFSESVLYGPMISQRFADNFERWLDEIQPHHTVAGSSGRGRITSSNPRDGFVGQPEQGIFMHPTIVSGVTSADLIYQQETFGPLVGVATFESFDQAIELANGHGYGLSSSIYTTNPGHAFEFRDRVSAGMVSVNNSTSGAEAHLPFGGNGRSGNGSRQSGIWVLDQFTRWQSMNWDYSGGLQRAQMDTTDLTADLGFRLDP